MLKTESKRTDEDVSLNVGQIDVCKQEPELGFFGKIGASSVSGNCRESFRIGKGCVKNDEEELLLTEVDVHLVPLRSGIFTLAKTENACMSFAAALDQLTFGEGCSPPGISTAGDRAVTGWIQLVEFGWALLEPMLVELTLLLTFCRRGLMPGDLSDIELHFLGCNT